MKQTKTDRDKQRLEQEIADGWADFWRKLDKMDVELLLGIWGPFAKAREVDGKGKE